MRRIKGGDAVASMPAVPALAGAEGYFTNGDPGSSVPATEVPDWWLNMMQEEIAGVLLAMGFPLDGTKSLNDALHGRLLNTQIFTASGTYTPTPGTSWIEVEVLGGGGSGGGAAAAGASQVSAGAGGAAGGFARRRIMSGFAGTPVTVGLGGTAPAAGAAGNAGGTSSFGAFCSAPGGPGGTLGPAAASTGLPNGGAQGPLGVGGDINGRGGDGAYALYFSPALAGGGGASVFGAGGGSNIGSASGIAAQTPGSGGGGGCQSVPSSPGAGGGAGKAGLVIIREYA